MKNKNYSNGILQTSIFNLKETAKCNSVTMRQAAMDIAVGRVVEATYARGLLP